MHRRSLLALLAGATMMAAAGSASAQWPGRPITLIVPWGAGGGTDATGRIIGSLLERELGQPINVVNRTGGSGVVGHTAIATAPADGYTLGIMTVEINMMHWQGLTQLTWQNYTPVAIYNADPAGVQVAVDAPYKTIRDLLDAVKANPGKLKASGTGQGGIWHLAIAGLLKDAGIDPAAAPWVPSQGAASGLQDMVAGGVQIVPCSIPEARAMLDAGKVRSLAIMDAQRNPAYPNVPTLKESIGSDWSMAAWRAVVGPKNLPKDVMDRLLPALKKVHQSQEFRDFMAKQGFGVIWAEGKDADAFLDKSNKDLGAVMKAVGLAKG
ncbi:MAG: tripartite tricarboxylate transporter substrate binding protein [Alphaproteobacteria bacterium]